MLRGCVDVDGRHHGACLSDFGVSQGHADQLAVAIRSPIAAQEEKHDGVAAMIGEGPGLSGLVDEREVRCNHAATIARDRCAALCSVHASRLDLGRTDLLGRHPDATVHPDGLTVHVAVRHEMVNEVGVLVRTAETLGMQHLLAE